MPINMPNLVFSATTDLEVMYLNLRAEGRAVIYDGYAVYEQINGTIYMLDGNGNPKGLEEKKEKAKKPQKLDVKAIQYELEDCLLHIMKGQPTIMKREHIGCEQTLGDNRFAHNYQRHDAENLEMYYIKYKGKKLAVVQRYPHRKATIYKQTEPKYLLVQRMLERVLYYSLPETKVEVI